MSSWTERISIALVLALAITNGASAQSVFGRNKVVYADREWWVLEDGWLHLYYYPEEEELARQTLAIAREAYDDFAEYFDFEFDEPIPIILYGTHHDFKQTHVTPGFVPEGTAGFTEFLKGRVALRATGSYTELRHLVRHELVHAFMLHELAKVHNAHGIYDYFGPPLWFIEGLAESIANDAQVDTDSQMFIRDAVLHDGLVRIPELWTIQGTFLMYKEGETIVNFLRHQYGDKVPAMLLDQWWRARDFEQLLELELGIDYEQLDADWAAYLKRRYFPEMMVRRRPAEEGHKLLENSFYDTAPKTLSLDADGKLELMAVSARGGTVSLFRFDLPEDGRPTTHRLVEGGRRAEYETIPLFRSRLDTFGGSSVAFVAKNGGQDALYVWDVHRRKREHIYRLNDLREISSPSFSPDGTRIVFSALSVAGFSDLWMVRLADGKLTRLTNDIYHDVHPDWHPTRDEIVFASDRVDPTSDDLSLFSMPAAAGGSIERLTSANGSDTEPVWSPDGDSIAFVSDRSGARNIHVFDADERTSRQVSDVTGGVYLPDWIDGDRLVASVYFEQNFHLFEIDAHREGPVDRELQTQHWAQRGPATVPADTEERSPKEYDIELGLDIVTTVVALDPDVPLGSGASIGFSDLLGDHQLYAHVSTFGDNYDIKDFNVGLSYSDLRSRINKHYGLFRLNTFQYLGLDTVQRTETRTGGYVGFTYPFSTFDRIVFTNVLRYLERPGAAYEGDQTGETWLGSLFVSVVHDDALWTWKGPRRGMRYNLTAGQSVDFLGNGFDRFTVQLDARRYEEITRHSTVALRGVYRQSFGSDTQIFYVGGPNDLRGYDWFQFNAEEFTLANVELRVPVVERLALGLPFALFDFPSIQGAAFNDVANIDGRIDQTGWIGSFGLSLYMTLIPPLAVRVDWVRAHDFDEIEPWDVDWSLSFLF